MHLTAVCQVTHCWVLVFMKVPEFPVFTRSGEVTVAFSSVREVVLTADELSRLYNFHHFIFRHVLRLEKLPMTFDAEHAETSNIVVPVNKGAVTCLCHLSLAAYDSVFIRATEHWPYSKLLLPVCRY